MVGGVQLVIRLFEFEGDVRVSGSAFEPRRIADLFQKETVGARAQKSAQASLRAVVGVEKLFFQEAGEELLREVCSVLAGQIPLEAGVFVDRLPVNSGDGINRTRACRKT